VPASRAPSEDGSGNSSELGASEPTISDNGLFCQSRLSNKNNGYLYVIASVSGAFHLKMQLNDALMES